MSEETEVKFCRDCRFYDNGDCHHPETARSPVFDRVTGEEINFWHSARTVRGRDGNCGHDAKLFEPRPSLIDRLKAWWKS